MVDMPSAGSNQVVELEEVAIARQKAQPVDSMVTFVVSQEVVVQQKARLVHLIERIEVSQVVVALQKT